MEVTHSSLERMSPDCTMHHSFHTSLPRHPAIVQAVVVLAAEARTTSRDHLSALSGHVTVEGLNFVVSSYRDNETLW